MLRSFGSLNNSTAPNSFSYTSLNLHFLDVSLFYLSLDLLFQLSKYRFLFDILHYDSIGEQYSLTNSVVFLIHSLHLFLSLCQKFLMTFKHIFLLSQLFVDRSQLLFKLLSHVSLNKIIHRISRRG